MASCAIVSVVSRRDVPTGFAADGDLSERSSRRVKSTAAACASMSRPPGLNRVLSQRAVARDRAAADGSAVDARVLVEAIGTCVARHGRLRLRRLRLTRGAKPQATVGRDVRVPRCAYASPRHSDVRPGFTAGQVTADGLRSPHRCRHAGSRQPPDIASHATRARQPLRLRLDAEAVEELVELVQRTIVDDQSPLLLAARAPHLDPHPQLPGQALFQVREMGRWGGW